MNDIVIDDRLVDTFCEVFGERHRENVTPDLSMDDIDEWDSMSFLDLVMSLESAYDVTFTDDEAVQMFQVGHIQRIVNSARLNKPHEDIANGCCLLHLLKSNSELDMSVVLLSGSSTREGLLRPREAESLLAERADAELGAASVGWFNLSISGLVMGETLQLLEQLPESMNGVVVIGTSPVIYAGCGVAEFERSVNYDRLPFASARMLEILGAHGYTQDPSRASVPIDLELWVDRYLKGRDLDEIRYDPYKYPTLAPWKPEKYDDAASILRYYNNSILNHEQSALINREFYHTIADWRDRTGIQTCMVDLTMHPKFLDYFERQGNAVSKYQVFIEEFCRERQIPLIEAVRDAGITEVDFRDPAHIVQHREEYTCAVIEGILSCVPC